MTETRSGIQVLSNHLIRRSPNKSDLLRRTPITLTDRDSQILEAVALHGFLTADLVEIAFFPPTGEARRSPSSCAYERLQQLWRWSLLDRVELPVARVLGGRRPYLYTLGSRGRPIVEQSWKTPVPQKRLDRWSPWFIEHDLKAAAVWANLKALLRGKEIQLVTWISERDLRARKLWVTDPQTNRRLPFLPDGYFSLGYPDGRTQVCLLEIDMGTLTLHRFRRKVRGLELALENGLFEREFGYDSFEVLILTHSLARLEQLQRSANEEVEGSEREWYFLATFELLSPDQFAGAGWLRLDGGSYHLLYGDEEDAGDTREGDEEHG